MRIYENSREKLKENIEEESSAMYSYWLDSILGVGSTTAGKLLESAGSAENIYHMSKEMLQKFTQEKIITNAQERNIMRAQEEEVYIKYSILKEKKIRCVPYGTVHYPEKLRDLANPPRNLYVCGKLPTTAMPSVGIVGARLCSDYGRYMARQFGMQLAENGIQIISGMAMGIDGISQKAALDVGGLSFGVLGCGVDICYPQENMELYGLLKEKGGLISEYIPGTIPRAGLFPMRNRIISGLSDLLLVIEARQKSGTLITVDAALEQGKEVYALPGRVTDALSAGCNALIRQGAGIAVSPGEVSDAAWELWEKQNRNRKQSIPDKATMKLSGKATVNEKRERTSENEQKVQNEQNEQNEQEKHNRTRFNKTEQLVYDQLSTDGKSVDELLGQMQAVGGQNMLPEVYAAVMQLCVKGAAFQENGRFYRKIADAD